jgi:hypothetical protein
MTIRIDVASGDIFVDGVAITPSTTPTDLPDNFAFGVAADIAARQAAVPVRFAHATVDDDGQEVGIDLRFERDVLFSVFLGGRGRGI